MHPLAAELAEARDRTVDLVRDLDERMLLGPEMAIVNAPLWELGHIGWFQEFWCLRQGGILSSLRPEADSLYDSAKVSHHRRWEVPLPSLQATLADLEAILGRVLARLESGTVSAGEIYYFQLALFHEDMHAEAMLYTRSTHGLPPRGRPAFSEPKDDGPLPGMVEVAGGRFLLGARQGGSFVFDNEKWAHEVRVEPFRLSRAPVTEGEFAEFVAAGGYRRESWWSPEGWRWRDAAGAVLPTRWMRGEGGRMFVRDFDRWRPLCEPRVLVHVNWHEAQAYCRFRGERLPTEAEWEFAATAGRGCDATGRVLRSSWPWGEGSPRSRGAVLDTDQAIPPDAAFGEEGESAFGCRQMIGTVWEWTASDFFPFPGFSPDPYREYSEPWFGTQKVLKGGALATRSRLIRPGYRNFFTPDRRDIWSGFRTAASL